ncbi:MAG: S8 family serine peptidase [Marinicellaceae bacterium]
MMRLAHLLILLVFFNLTVQAENLRTQVLEEINNKGEVRIVVALKLPDFDRSNMLSLNTHVKSSQNKVLSALGTDDYQIIHQYKSVPGLALTISSIGVLEKLMQDENVLKVDLDVGGVGALNESRPYINADFIQNLGVTGSGVTVAVVDSGFDTNHADLQDNLVYEHCVCTNCCPTGGSVGDGPGSAEDDHSHGTHVSGIITSNGTTAPLGIAPETGIVAVKMLDSNNSFCCSSDIVGSLDWILNNRADVKIVNMSLGTSAEFAGDCDNSTSWTMNLASVISSLKNNGVLSVVSSMNNGNTNGMGAPACISSAIAVGATGDNNDNIASFSNSSTSLDILAPGVSITSTFMDGGSINYSGTSMAAPHVTAVGALLYDLYPNASASQVESCLRTSSTLITDTRNNITRPRLNAVESIACIDTIFSNSFE